MEKTIKPHTEVQLPKLHNWGTGTWREQAACRGKDTSWFFPEHESLEGLTPLQKARRHYGSDRDDPKRPRNGLSRARLLCVKCPVRDECLKFALENFIVHGLYGGLPSRDRRGMTADNFDSRIPMRHVMADLQRVRRMDNREKTVPLAQDVAVLLNTTMAKAERMLRDNDLPEFV